MSQSQLGALIYVLAVEWLIVERLILGANSNDFFMHTLNKLTQFYTIFERYITKDQYTHV